MKKIYKIEVDCANCANLMEEATGKINGIKEATVNFMTQKMMIDFCDDCDEKTVMAEVKKVCKKVDSDFEIEL